MCGHHYNDPISCACRPSKVYTRVNQNQMIPKSNDPMNTKPKPNLFKPNNNRFKLTIDRSVIFDLEGAIVVTLRPYEGRQYTAGIFKSKV